tara:strand:- start:8069 stop:8296 length:228 start_codon:yes stop_codon:yes gene_type:complete
MIVGSVLSIAILSVPLMLAIYIRRRWPDFLAPKQPPELPKRIPDYVDDIRKQIIKDSNGKSYIIIGGCRYEVTGE